MHGTRAEKPAQEVLVISARPVSSFPLPPGSLCQAPSLEPRPVAHAVKVGDRSGDRPPFSKPKALEAEVTTAFTNGFGDPIP
ncbi:hypothetical protein GCM10009642_10190 [Nocardiopsis metallicus]